MAPIRIDRSGALDVALLDARLTLYEICETLDFPAHLRERDAFTTEEYGRAWVLVPTDTES